MLCAIPMRRRGAAEPCLLALPATVLTLPLLLLSGFTELMLGCRLPAMAGDIDDAVHVGGAKGLMSSPLLMLLLGRRLAADLSFLLLLLRNSLAGAVRSLLLVLGTISLVRRTIHPLLYLLLLLRSLARTVHPLLLLLLVLISLAGAVPPLLLLWLLLLLPLLLLWIGFNWVVSHWRHHSLLVVPHDLADGGCTALRTDVPELPTALPPHLRSPLR